MHSQTPDPIALEAEARWGHTEAYREAARRTAAYGEEDWRRIRHEQEAVEAAFADAFLDGAPADGPVATAQAGPPTRLRPSCFAA